MRSEDYCTWLSVRLSVCLSVGYHVFCDYVQQNSDTNGFIARLTKYYCVQKLWREKQVNKPICKLAQAYLDRVGLLCVPWRHKKSQRMVCINFHMLLSLAHVRLIAS